MLGTRDIGINVDQSQALSPTRPAPPSEFMPVLGHMGAEKSKTPFLLARHGLLAEKNRVWGNNALFFQLRRAQYPSSVFFVSLIPSQRSSGNSLAVHGRTWSFTAVPMWSPWLGNEDPTSWAVQPESALKLGALKAWTVNQLKSRLTGLDLLNQRNSGMFALLQNLTDGKPPLNSQRPEIKKQRQSPPDSALTSKTRGQRCSWNLRSVSFWVSSSFYISAHEFWETFFWFMIAHIFL